MLFLTTLSCVFIFINGINSAPSHSVVTKWTNYPNDRPIIGVLAQEHHFANGTLDGDSYIAASYVKFLESGGARVIPIYNNQTKVELIELLDQINGVLFPGGGASLFTSLYARDGAIILQYAQEANDKGDYFPIWGTCLGFELLLTQLAGNKSVFVNCSASDMALPLNFSTGATDGRLFSQLPTDVYQFLLNEDVTANYHTQCLTPEAVVANGLDKFIKVLSTNFDKDGLEFVSTYESINYPIYGVQWHPEKNPWEWTMKYENIPHTPDAIRVTQYFASFFANEARKNVHKFKKPSREQSELIYNMNPLFSGKTGSDFEQIYKFAIKNRPKIAKTKVAAKPAISSGLAHPVVEPVRDSRAKPPAAGSSFRVVGDCSLLMLVSLMLLAVR